MERHSPAPLYLGASFTSILGTGCRLSQPGTWGQSFSSQHDGLSPRKQGPCAHTAASSQRMSEVSGWVPSQVSLGPRVHGEF